MGSYSPPRAESTKHYYIFRPSTDRFGRREAEVDLIRLRFDSGRAVDEERS